jgi:hypothetical protein
VGQTLPPKDVNGHLRMEPRGDKYGQSEIPLFDDERKFSAGQNDAGSKF